MKSPRGSERWPGERQISLGPRGSHYARSVACTPGKRRNIREYLACYVPFDRVSLFPPARSGSYLGHGHRRNTRTAPFYILCFHTGFWARRKSHKVIYVNSFTVLL